MSSKVMFCRPIVKGFAYHTPILAGVDFFVTDHIQIPGTQNNLITGFRCTRR